MSVCPRETTPLTQEGFSWNLAFKDFSKVCRDQSLYYPN